MSEGTASGAEDGGSPTTPAKGAPPPGMSSDLNDDVAQQAEYGMSGSAVDEHGGTEAPASEGQLPG